MAREKGSKKTGGRVMGTPNRKSLFFTDALLENNFDISKEFIQLYTTASSDQKIALLMKAIDFSFPKRRAIEVDLKHEMDSSVQPQYNLHALEIEELKELQKLVHKMTSATTLIN